VDRLQLLAAVMAFDPPVHLFGGVAEDALLHGSWVRPHDDIDVLVARGDLERHLDSAETIGFRVFEVRFEPLPDTPVVVGSVEGDLNLEISVYDRTPDGRPFFYMIDEHGGVVRVEMTTGIFDHPPSTIDGAEVRTVAPLAQHQIRAGIAAAGGFGPLRPKDVGAQRALEERFFPGVDPETLAPTIVPLADS
jgi:hypothetical protein